jgi:hypothetical protein
MAKAPVTSSADFPRKLVGLALAAVIGFFVLVTYGAVNDSQRSVTSSDNIGPVACNFTHTGATS